MKIDITGPSVWQADVSKRLELLASLSREEARRACYANRYTLTRMHECGSTVEDAATWVGRKLGVGVPADEQARRQRIAEAVRAEAKFRFQHLGHG